MKKYVLPAVIVIAAVSAFFYVGRLFSPGSYPYVEKFVFDVPQSDLIKAAIELKRADTSLVVPSEVGLADGKKDANDHWYHIYFYYPDEDQIVYAWIRQIEKGETVLALVSINEGLYLGNWKRVNKDFSGDENETQIEKFKSKIVEPLQKYLNK